MRKQSRLGDWYVFCDICGQRCFASEATKLSTYTGRGGLIVCPKDVDAIDYGQVPYTPKAEENVPLTRSNHTDTTQGATEYDLEEGALAYFLATSQDNLIIEPSQNDETGLVVYERD